MRFASHISVHPQILWSIFFLPLPLAPAVIAEMFLSPIGMISSSTTASRHTVTSVRVSLFLVRCSR